MTNNLDPTPDPVDVHVGQRIRMRRLMVGVTQTQLADELGLTFQQVQKYEKGTNRVSCSKLYAICKVLDVAPEYFFEGLPSTVDGRRSRRRDAADAAILNTPDGIQLMRSFRNIRQKSVRRHFVGLAKSMADEAQLKEGRGGPS